MQVQRLSVFDIFKIGVGPSSSHTLGPWRAAEQFVALLAERHLISRVQHVRVRLFGSLAKTGRGHGTDVAVQAGLLGADPVTCDMRALQRSLEVVRGTRELSLSGRTVAFDPDVDIEFHGDEVKPFHPNALTFGARLDGGEIVERTYFSVGGGFVVEEDQRDADGTRVNLPYPVDTGADLLRWCGETGWPVWRVVLENERSWRAEHETRDGILRCWDVMRECIYRGCQVEGDLPGGLGVKRRAPAAARRLLEARPYRDYVSWVNAIRSGGRDFSYILDWVNTFGLAVNEENACFGRVVTAPTNGAAGVIPAVLQYYLTFGAIDSRGHRCFPSDHGDEGTGILRFFCTASEIGCLFKKGATISAAMGGCQAEIGVSSAMAAGALTESLGGSPGQALMAAEIAMEHHLGLTCDPVGGLVQIPCIERNTMGAVKAITATRLALQGNPDDARVSLDAVISTMRQTALDMSAKYKETSEGGLAVHIPVNLSEC